MGRLFDAVAALIGRRQHISYEAQAAIDLEILAAHATVRDSAYAFRLEGGVADPGPVLRAIVDDVRDHVPTTEVAWRFHEAVVDLVVAIATDLRRERG